MKLWRIALLFLVVITGVAILKREPLAMAYLASKLDETTIDERVALMRDHIEILTPDGEGPFPVVMQLHGCAGIRVPFQHQWAAIANKAGYAAIIVDSNGARGMNRELSLERVCGGKTLLGQERASDIAAVLEIAKSDARLDTTKVVLAGWSHGAWTTMDYLTMDPAKKALPGFKQPQADLPDIDGAVLFYPYCGLGAHSRYADYVQSPPTLALIAGADEIVEEEICIRHFNKRKKAGAPIDMVIYENANHVFDDPFLEQEYQSWFNQDYFDDAAARYEAFLQNLR